MASESAILGWMLALPAAGGVAILALPDALVRRGRVGVRGLALAVSLATLIVSIMAANLMDWHRAAAAGIEDLQLALRVPLAGILGTPTMLGVDGLSMPAILLTCAVSVLACWAAFGIKRHLKTYFAAVLFWLSAALGAFAAADGVLFSAFLLISAVALFFVMAVRGPSASVDSGGRSSQDAAWKYFWFALAGSMAVLVASLGARRGTPGSPDLWFWLMCAGLAVWLPAIGLHRWLPDVFSFGDTPAAMIAAAFCQTAGAYGMMRICLPLFAAQAGRYSATLAAVATLTMVYGALAALAQKDLRRLVAYASMSQMGFVLLGIAGRTATGASGAAFLLIGHAVAMAMMIFVCGMIRERIGHCSIERLGGLGGHMPVFAGWSAVGFLSAMGVPGLCVFVGELLVLMGTFEAAGQGARSGTSDPMARPALMLWLAVIGAAVMALLAGCFAWTYQRVFMGPPRPEHSNVARMSMSEKWILVTLAMAAVVLGLMPTLVTEPIRAAIEAWVRGGGG